MGKEITEYTEPKQKRTETEIATSLQNGHKQTIENMLEIRIMLKQQKIDYPDWFPSEFDDIISDIEKSICDMRIYIED
jgi:hypothetical protein